MNKRINGFTLIELLAVVTIIGFISVLVLPNILKGINDKKQQISDTNMKILEAAANMYIEQHPNRYVSTFEGDGSTYCIALQELVNSNLLTTPFKDIDGNEVDYSKLLKATYNSNYNTFTYNNALYDNSTCTETINYVSRPILSDGMIPIVYEENTVKKADVNSKWYNYTNRKWANAVLVKDSSRYIYSNAVAGTTINEEDILGYFVWIPRFRYQLFNSDTATEINVVFESVGTIKSTGTQIGEWLTHPAFTYNNQELSGIWVGKYEASNSDNNIVIKSGLTPWTDINYVEANELAIQMTNENNIYGLKNVNTHMTRNSEWGALAYLTNSIYGNNQNNSSTGNNTGIYNISGNKEFVILDNESENSLGYALSETNNWTTDNSYPTTENLYLTRGNNSIYNYQNSSVKDENTTFRITLTNNESQNQNYQRKYIVTFDPDGGTLSETTKEVSYHEPYGNLPTPTREGYTFLGWNGRNYYNYQDTTNVTNGVITDDYGWITINVKSGGRYYNYYTHDLNVQFDTNYIGFLEVKYSSNTLDGSNRFCFDSGNSIGHIGYHHQFLGNCISDRSLVSDRLLKIDLKTDVSSGNDLGLRTYYDNANDGNKTVIFRISVLDVDDSITENNFEYEPYYIIPSTTVVQQKNHTLKAIWQANS